MNIGGRIFWLFYENIPAILTIAVVWLALAILTTAIFHLWLRRRRMMESAGLLGPVTGYDLYVLQQYRETLSGEDETW